MNPEAQELLKKALALPEKERAEPGRGRTEKPGRYCRRKCRGRVAGGDSSKSGRGPIRHSNNDSVG